jgi:hypothetical protein
MKFTNHQSRQHPLRYLKRTLTYLSITLVVILSSACQLLEPKTAENHPKIKEEPTNTLNYAQYYLRLQQLSEGELLAEIYQQKIAIESGSIEAKVNLILIYSLPQSPTHSAYKAKSSLNQFFQHYPEYQFSNNDLAFISLLKDQLNMQLSLFKQLVDQEINQEKQYDEAIELTKKVTQLQEQIIQLKRIEKNINGHGM